MNAENLAEMVKKFQCPGCVRGSSTECGSYTPNDAGCNAHVLGTLVLGVGNIALGLPKGFNRPGFAGPDRPLSRMLIRLFPEKSRMPFEWDNSNVAVWALEKDGYLFVRTCMPRLGMLATDVIEGGTLDMCPKGTIDVGKFYDEID
jgi:hypothetical protein